MTSIDDVAARSHDNAQQPAPEPLGPDSLTWRYYGQLVGFAGGPVPQLLQVMHPVLGRGVDQHSNVKSDPFGRLLRSMGPIYGAVYDGPQAVATGSRIRGFHEHITGTMPDGTRYSGLHPEVFHWAHATFAHGLVYGFSELLGVFSRAEQEQLYAESKVLYAMYGVSARHLPPTLDDFDVYLDHYVTNVLEYTPAARWLLATFRRPPQPPGFTWMPDALWRPVARIGGHTALALAAGLLPPPARDKLGLPWRRRDRAEYRAIVRALRTAVAATPPALRYHPRALAGWNREATDRGVSVTQLIRRGAEPQRT